MAYQLRIPDDWQVHLVFNVDLLTGYRELKYKSQKRHDCPQLQVIGDHLEYEVKKIEDVRECKGVIQYLVKWKGYPREENT